MYYGIDELLGNEETTFCVGIFLHGLNFVRAGGFPEHIIGR